MAQAILNHQERRKQLFELLNESRFSGRFESCKRKVSLRIAGVRVDFLTDSAPLARRVAEYFAAYAGEGPAQACIRARVVPGRTLWEDPDAEFHIEGDSVLHRDFVAVREPAADDRSRDEAVALLAPGIDDAFHNLLRWFFPRLLLRNGAFLLHGAGVIRGGKGYAFFGQSGAGKSTTVALISSSDPEVRVIGDDAVIIQMNGAGPVLHSAPLGCGYSRMAPSRMAVPLAGMFALRQDSSTRIEPLLPGEGMAALLASAMAVGFDESADQRLDLAGRFASASPGIHALHFRRDTRFWRMVLDSRLEELKNGRDEARRDKRVDERIARGSSGKSKRNEGPVREAQG